MVLLKRFFKNYYKHDVRCICGELVQEKKKKSPTVILLLVTPSYDVLAFRASPLIYMNHIVITDA